MANWLLESGRFPVSKDFREAIRELSWIDDQNINLEPRYADTDEVIQ